MKKTIFLIISAFCFMCQSHANSATNNHQLHVTGIGEISLAPDRARVPIGVQIKHEDLLVAREQVDDVINKLFKLCKQLKIDRKNIKSTQILTYPVYDKVHNQEKNHYEDRLTGYNVYRQLEVNLTDLEKIGDLMHEAVLLGATNMSSPYFYISNKEKLHDKVIDKAISNAKDKSSQMAKKLDIELGKIKNVGNHTVNYSYPYRNHYPMVGRAKMRLESAAYSPSNNYTTGEIKLNTSINITYEILD